MQVKAFSNTLIHMTILSSEHLNVSDDPARQREQTASRLATARPRTGRAAELALYFETSPRYTPSAALTVVQESLVRAEH